MTYYYEILTNRWPFDFEFWYFNLALHFNKRVIHSLGSWHTPARRVKIWADFRLTVDDEDWMKVIIEALN